jgi:hypothetical protein
MGWWGNASGLGTPDRHPSVGGSIPLKRRDGLAQPVDFSLPEACLPALLDDADKRPPNGLGPSPCRGGADDDVRPTRPRAGRRLGFEDDVPPAFEPGQKKPLCPSHPLELADADALLGDELHRVEPQHERAKPRPLARLFRGRGQRRPVRHQLLEGVVHLDGEGHQHPREEGGQRKMRLRVLHACGALLQALSGHQRWRRARADSGVESDPGVAVKDAGAQDASDFVT